MKAINLIDPFIVGGSIGLASVSWLRDIMNGAPECRVGRKRVWWQRNCGVKDVEQRSRVEHLDCRVEKKGAVAKKMLSGG